MLAASLGDPASAALTARAGIGGGACCAPAIMLKNWATLLLESEASFWSAGGGSPSEVPGCGLDVSDASRSAMEARSGGE